MRRFLITLSILVLLAACSTAKPAEEESIQLAGCYTAQVGADHAYLDLKTDGVKIRGTLEYAFTQKDSSWGLISGTASETAVELNYEFLSEGLLSTRTLTLSRDGAKLSGEGWTYQQTDTCGIGEGWRVGLTNEVRVDTFHDPETGYYARSFFKIAGPLGGYNYRCIATVVNKSQQIVAEWVGSGVTDTSNATRTQNMQTNIRPEQVSEISAGSVICQTRAS